MENYTENNFNLYSHLIKVYFCVSFGLIIYFSMFIYRIKKILFTPTDPDVSELASILQISLEKKDKEILYLHNQLNNIKDILNKKINTLSNDLDDVKSHHVFLEDSYNCLPGQMAMM
jgi:hypothetical protein